MSDDNIDQLLKRFGPRGGRYAGHHGYGPLETWDIERSRAAGPKGGYPLVPEDSGNTPTVGPPVTGWQVNRHTGEKYKKR